MDGKSNGVFDPMYRAASGCDADRTDEPGVQHEPVPVFEEHCLKGGKTPPKASIEAGNKRAVC
jgi:hypothetical protein